MKAPRDWGFFWFLSFDINKRHNISQTIKFGVQTKPEGSPLFYSLTWRSPMVTTYHGDPCLRRDDDLSSFFAIFPSSQGLLQGTLKKVHFM